MDLEPYVEGLRQRVLVSAEAGGEEARVSAARLLAPLDTATRLTLLEVLSAAAAEITRDLSPGSVDLRLRGRDPSFVVTAPLRPSEDADIPPDTHTPPKPPIAETADHADDGATSRISLRLPEYLKTRVEDAAGDEGLSVNAWLVRAVGAAVDSRLSAKRRGYGGQRYSGWVR
jgi:hypothetical protein